MQEASQRLTSVVLGLPGHAGIHRAIKAVIRPRIHVPNVLRILIDEAGFCRFLNRTFAV